jgi:tetratricopeptide (TPR) repeat protein
MKFFNRGDKKPASDPPQKPYDQQVLDLMSTMKESGGTVLDLTGGTTKELSSSDIEGNAKARSLEKIGDAHYARGDYARAISSYEQALAICPDEVLFMNIGNAYCSMEQFEKGIPFLEKALERNPSYERARKNLETAKAVRASHQRLMR